MRTKLVLTFILCLTIVVAFGSKAQNNQIIKFLSTAKSKEAILAWGEEHGTGCRDFEFTYDGNHALVMLLDSAFGVYAEDIFVFGKAKGEKKWHFSLLRTAMVKVNVCQEDDKLIFKTVTDDVILEQSFDTICHKEVKSMIHDILPYKSTSKEAIFTWGKQQKGSCRDFEYTHGNVQALVLLLDGGDDTCHETIYVFGNSKEQENLRLILTCLTDTTVSVEQKDDKLVFKNASDNTILEQPFDTISRLDEIVRKKILEKEKKTDEN